VPRAARARVQRGQEQAQLRELAVGSPEALRERAHLRGDSGGGRALELVRGLAQPPLEPCPLGLEDERAGVPVGERLLHVRERGGVRGVRRRAQELFDRPPHRLLAPATGLPLSNPDLTERYGPGGPSSRPRRPTLDDRRARRNTDCLVAARLRALVAVFAAAAALPAGAAAAPASPIGPRLDRALHVPHVRLAAS